MGRMLTDKHMHAANTMLSTQFPTLLGLQSTLLVQTAGFDNMDLDFGGGYLLEGTIIDGGMLNSLMVHDMSHIMCYNS